MATTSLVTVVCTANVCRSVYAAELLADAWSPLPVRVAGAGLATHPRLAPCPVVGARLGARGLGAPQSTSRPVHEDTVAGSALVLALTPEQRASLGKMVPKARTRIFTLIEACLIAEALLERAPDPMNFAEWCQAVSALRGRVRMPVAPVQPRGFLSRRSREFEPAIGIADGHTSERPADHDTTLNQVESYCERLAAAARAVVTTDERSR